VADIASPGGVAQGLEEGQVTITAALGGVRGTAALRVTLWPSAGPAIAALAPDRGTVGTIVLIHGSGFSPRVSDNWAAFNGTPATVSAATETLLTVSVPAGATTGAVTVTVGGRTAGSPVPFTVPQTLAIVPSEVTVALGGTVGFRATLDGVAAAGVTWRVNGVPGGGGDVGTISTSGLYTAPAALPAVLPLQVDAVLPSDPTRIVTGIVRLVAQTSGTLMTAPVSVGVLQAGSAQALSGPLSVAVGQPAGAEVLSGLLSVAVDFPASAQVVSTPVSVTAAPVVTAVIPAVGQIGGSAGVEIRGVNLQDASAVRVLRDGQPDPAVTAGAVSAAADGSGVTCTMTAASTAVAGARVLQVVTPHGPSSSANIGTNVFTVSP
jgi:hypothetical protein